MRRKFDQSESEMRWQREDRCAAVAKVARVFDVLGLWTADTVRCLDASDMRSTIPPKSRNVPVAQVLDLMRLWERWCGIILLD